MTTKPIEFSILRKLHIGPKLDLGYLMFGFRSWGCHMLFLNSDPLDAKAKLLEAQLLVIQI